MPSKVQFRMLVDPPAPHWERALQFVTQKIWDRICHDLGDTDVSPILVYNLTSMAAFAVINGQPYIFTGVQYPIELAVEMVGETYRERVFRAYRATVCEELVHCHDFLMGLPVENSSSDPADALIHYSRPSEHRALELVVRHTGLRRELLAAVDAL